MSGFSSSLELVYSSTELTSLLSSVRRSTPTRWMHVQLARDILSAKRSLSRHRQQGERTITRLAAIRELVAAATDLEDELKAHILVTSKAFAYHKHCITDAAYIYESISNNVAKLLASPPAERSNELAVFTKQASESLFEISSDNQQVKLVVAWNRTPQPGITSYLSGITNYGQFLVFHSCGTADGDSKFARNHVYVREEFVSGAQNSFEKLSTLAVAPLGRAVSARFQSPLVLTGYDKDGKNE